jgi:PAS domain S-box-containing protein
VFLWNIGGLVEYSKGEEYFRALIERAFDVITILDGMGFIRYESPSIKGILGYDEDELVGKNIFDYLHPDDVQVALDSLTTGLERPGNLSHLEVRFRHKDGSWRWFGGTGSNFLEDPDIKGILLNSRDITESKEADMILRESESRYRATFESTGTAMFLVDRDAIISDTNREMEKTFGYTREEAVGKMHYMDFLTPGDVELVKANSLKLLRGEVEGPIQYEVRARHKTGRVIDALISINMLPGMGNSVVSLLDITEKKKYERELLDRAEQLKDFLDIAAHELRHPTTLLKGYALTLKKHWKILDPETLDESLDAMGIGADRLVRVVQELLDMSRIERDRFPVVKEDVSLEPLVKRGVDEMLAKASDVAIQVKFQDEIDTAYVDEESLMRLLIVLLDNAVEHSPSGSMVEIVVGKYEGESIVSVLDRGIGIPDEYRERIFERFFQVEDVLQHSSPGLGLGLYIGKRIVEAHGGRIWCEPREGGGSAFRFTLPPR